MIKVFYIIKNSDPELIRLFLNGKSIKPLPSHLIRQFISPDIPKASESK